MSPSKKNDPIQDALDKIRGKSEAQKREEARIKAGEKFRRSMMKRLNKSFSEMGLDRFLSLPKSHDKPQEKPKIKTRPKDPDLPKKKYDCAIQYNKLREDGKSQKQALDILGKKYNRSPQTIDKWCKTAPLKLGG